MHNFQLPKEVEGKQWKVKTCVESWWYS